MLALAACHADEPGDAPRLVCDLCAAPGGKASALLESVGSGFLLANEPVKSRLPALEYNLARTGEQRYAISSQDPEQLADQLPSVFDLVLADVPCSGQALLGRGKQTMASVSPAQVEHSASRARRILAAAARLLKPGGRLVLSTCTFAEAENESQVRWLKESSQMRSSPVESLESFSSGDRDLEGVYRLWPHRHDCAGSFAASLVKEGDSDSVQTSERSGKPLKGKRSKRRQSGERPPEELSDWFDEVPERMMVAGPVVRGWPDDSPPWVERVAVGGPEWAYRTGRTWKPSHGAALRRHLSLNVPVMELSEEHAREFLAGHPIMADQKGWCVVRSEGRGLGWVKASGGLGKNHLPAAARLELPGPS